jgi:protoporphyrin/coproporphyrin ferrochelatase
MSERTAVLLLAHGTPDSLDEIPEYLRNITGGRPLPESAVEEIRHRYSLIGASPLTSLTLEQGRLLSHKLCLPVYVGMRNWKPYIADVVGKMRADGVSRIVAICLAPQNSRTSVGLYRRAVFAEATGIDVDFVEGWADHPLLADAFAERLRAVLEPFSAEAGAPVPVLFTAHSVPLRTVQPQLAGDAGADSLPPDPYETDAKNTAALVAERMGGLKPDNWFFAFQSQGMSGGPWIGPTVEDTLTALANKGVRRIVLQPVGFLCDHVEILYDIDIGFRQFAANLDMELRRPESLNDSPLLIAALADLARQGIARLG